MLISSRRATAACGHFLYGRRLAALLAFTVFLVGCAHCRPAAATEPLEIGSQRELFVDHHLVDSLHGAELRMHAPRPAGTALEFDLPWEGAFSGYVTIIHDSDRLRMYYRGVPEGRNDGNSGERTCYAESTDGIHWTKPELGIHPFAGSTANNIILQDAAPVTHNFCPFLDTRPDVPAAQRYKALGGTAKSGLIGYASADGLHWQPLGEEPIFTDSGWVFDSQNVPFWSESEACYVLYYRRSLDGIRSVARATSPDFMQWSAPEQMQFGQTPPEHLYTNQTGPYFRAPHIYLGVAARFFPGRQVLSASEARRIGVDPRYFGDISDAVLLSTRGGDQYDRTFMEAFIRPGLGLENWVSRTNYPALGIVPTGDGELSLYVQKNYGQPTARLDRYTLRTDGFASLHAPYSGGTLQTKPLVFTAAPAAEVLARQTAAEEQAPAPVELTSTAIHGEQSLNFREATTLELPETQQLGRQATLAIALRDIPPGHRRIFSAYDGGSPAAGELILDVHNPGFADGSGLRFIYGDFSLTVSSEDLPNFHDGQPHFIAMVWDAGNATLYVDGEPLASDTSDSEALQLALGNLLLGEDYPPAATQNEPLLGVVDDVVVLRSALTGQQVRRLANEGAGWLSGRAQPSRGDLVLTFEEDSAPLVRDRAGDSLAQHVQLPLPPGAAPQELELNFATSAAGYVRVELQDATGNPIPGYSLAEATELIGDDLARVVTWNQQSDVSPLAGKPVRIYFEMKDADVYSLRFR